MNSSKKVLEEETKKFIRDIVLNALGSGLLILIGTTLRFVPLSILISVITTLFLTTSAFLYLYRKNNNRFITELGITGMWRNQKHFEKSKGISYSEYCKRFVQETKDGNTIRILGYDWVELFVDTIVLNEDVYGENGTSRLRFEVILADPESPMAVEKRAWEMTLKKQSGDLFYNEGSAEASFMRLRTKIQSCLTVARIFNQARPQYFKIKLTPTVLNFSIIMRDDAAIGVIYALPWKGIDSIIFEAKKLDSNNLEAYGRGFYGFLRGYFDSLWQDPDWRRVKVSEK